MLKSGLPTTTSRLRALEPNWSPHRTPDTGEVSIKATLTIEMTSGQHRAIPQSQHQQYHGNRADQALVVKIRDAPGEPASKTGIEEYKATRIEFNNCWDALKHDHNKKKYHYISLIIGPQGLSRYFLY